jgi:hypothetical protein
VANSRRRERELARRRYERRRLREMEARAKRRRRNTIIGASAGTAAVIAGAIVLGFVVFGGDDKDKVDAAGQPSGTPTPSVSSTAPAPTGPPKKCAPIKPNPPAKGQPTVPPVTGNAPTKLVTHDVKKGHGRAAAKGDTLSVTYIGISCSTGTVFDASYKHGGQPFPVENLGQAQVIQGWNQGLIGMQAGGVRELVIPPALGYGPTGSPPTIAPNEVLIFLVTAKSVKAG